METRNIFFIGKPGCGKGTQAKLLSEKTGWPTFGSGDEFRKMAKEDSALGHKVKEENDAGILQPHWLAMYIYLKALFSISENQSAIFDGFNRKIPEAELVISSLKWLNRPFTTIHIVISDNEAMKRLAIRGLESDRVDDHFVPERLKEFNKFTQDAIGLFRDAGSLIEINGEQPREQIAADIQKALGLA